MIHAHPEPHPTVSPVVLEVVRAVARRESVEETDLPPLGEYVDTDALTGLVQNGAVATFEYASYRVTVDNEGTSLTSLDR